MKTRVVVLPVVILWLVITLQALATTTSTVVNTNDDGPGSLREAIIEVGVGGGDAIVFNIPGDGVHSITLTKDLPSIIGSVRIDGSTQPGFSGTPLIEIKGAGATIDGLVVNGSTNCQILNLAINGARENQIRVFGGTNVTIQGNYIGLDATGTAVVPGSGVGILVALSNGVLIGGPSVAQRNLISSDNSQALLLKEAQVTVQGNYVGLNVTGTAAAGAPSVGVEVDNGNGTIGGANPGERNVIVGFAGVVFGGNPALALSSGSLIGNYIGTDATGMTALNLGNGKGVGVAHANGVMIQGNVISGNGDGLVVTPSGFTGSSSNSTTIKGNLIGVAVDGATALGNSHRGIDIFSSSNNRVGGTDTSEHNVIAFNGDAGVTVRGGGAGNAVLGNAIFSNGGIGIDLEANGPTFNDPGDSDSGPNNLQNYPIISSVMVSGGNVTLTGTLNSVASVTFRLEFFSSTKRDASGFGEGETFLGFANVTTDASGNASYSVTFPVSGTAKAFAATATEPLGSTSEFSPMFLSRLQNISTRMRVLTGERALIGGFIISGSDNKQVLVRGIGPSLASFFNGVLQDTTLSLQGNDVSITNDNWKIRDDDGGSQQAEIEATTIPPTDDRESALVQTIAPGAYTAILRGKDDTTGIGLIEVYDLNQSAGARLSNVSTRGFVDTGDSVMIGGIIIGPNTTAGTNVLVRAIGPSLSGSGITDPLLDPTLELYDGSGTTIATSDNWKVRDSDGGSQQAEIEATKIPPTDDHESALVRTLAPGNYTAIVRGKNATTGVALVEAYDLQ